MIDTAILTWFPRGATLGDARWKDEATHSAAWLLCVRLLRLQFMHVRLHADAAGAAMLAHVPFTEVVVRERHLDPRLWGVEKLASSMLTEEPHIHVDGDFFWWNVTDEARRAPVLYQCFEPFSRGYGRLRRAMTAASYEGVGSLPVGAGPIVCAGIAGGADVEAVRTFARRQVEAATVLTELQEASTRRVLEAGRYASWDRLLDAANYWFEQYGPVACYGRQRVSALSVRKAFTAPNFDHIVRQSRQRTISLVRIASRAYNTTSTRDLAHHFDPDS